MEPPRLAGEAFPALGLNRLTTPAWSRSGKGSCGASTAAKKSRFRWLARMVVISSRMAAASLSALAATQCDRVVKRRKKECKRYAKPSETAQPAPPASNR